MNQEKQILNETKTILSEEKEILKEIKKEEKKLLGLEKKFLTALLGTIILSAALAGGFMYWRLSQNRIYIEKSQIFATAINLSPKSSGVLEEVYVNEGDQVLSDTVVARVGNELIKTKVNGKITFVNKNFGTMVGPGVAVVSMIDSGELRVVGRAEEDKGLQYISVGQQAMFTVDAFSGKKFFGTVDEISPVSHDSDVVFNISNKREVKQFDVKVRFDTALYPELKSGMSAKIWIYRE